MKPTVWIVLAALCAIPAAALATAANNACEAHVAASVDAVARGDYTLATRHFAPALAHGAPQIQRAWGLIQTSAGAYRAHGRTTLRVVGAQPLWVTPITFARAPWDVVSTCDARGRITGWRLMPAADLTEAGAVAHGKVAAKRPVQARVLVDGARVEPLAVPSRFGPLRGALVLPAGRGPFPAVVLVAGSGPADLNETVGGSKPFRDIARRLAADGVASLRYDKRATDYPMQVGANPRLTVDEEETDDALTAAHLLARQAHVDLRRVFVLGHSEGGMLAPRIARRDRDLAGIIMLAAPARPPLTVLEEQTREQGARLGLPKAQVAASEKALAHERALLAKAEPGHPPPGAFGGVPQSWWLSLRNYHPLAVARTLRLPMLLLQGGSDFQVSPTKDFDAWKTALAGKPDVTFRLFPGLSHLFTPAGKTLTEADYAKPEHVDPAVIGFIANWIKAQPPAK